MGTHRRQAALRGGFRHGAGSSVYFFRTLHGRPAGFRFFLTRTMLSYLAAALGAGFFASHFMDEPLDYVPVLLLAVLVFFRTILSPVTEDVRTVFFLMQPDPIWSKLFFSLLGGSVNCALDVFLPLMAGSMAAGFSPLRGLLYLPVLVILDFFASASGAFTDVSLPQSIGTSFKQVIQVLLLYFGLIFDGAILVYGINSKHNALGFGLMTALNLLFGLTFLGLTGVWLSPSHGLNAPSGGFVPDVTGARRGYTRIGLALTGMYLGIHAGQSLFARMLPEQPVLALYLPIYAIGLPIFLLLMGAKPADTGAKRSIPFKQLLLLLPVCFFVMYGGNVLGFLVQGVLGALVPFHFSLFQTADPSQANPVPQALLLAAAAPVMEEYVFRRCVLDRLLPYGEKAALLTSALLFALFHETVNQVCYAFLLGLVFGYLYLKTGRLRNTIFLHVIINSMTSLVLPALMLLATKNVSGETMYRVPLSKLVSDPGVVALLVYLALLFVVSLLGAVLFFHGVRERNLSGDGVSMKTVFSSWGMLLFVVGTGVVLLGGA